MFRHITYIVQLVTNYAFVFSLFPLLFEQIIRDGALFILNTQFLLIP